MDLSGKIAEDFAVDHLVPNNQLQKISIWCNLRVNRTLKLQDPIDLFNNHFLFISCELADDSLRVELVSDNVDMSGF